MFMWRCSSVFVLPSSQKLLLRKPVCRSLRREVLASAFVPMPPVLSHPSPEALKRSRSALGLAPPVVVDDGPDADEQAAGKTVCPDDARILEAW